MKIVTDFRKTMLTGMDQRLIRAPALNYGLTLSFLIYHEGITKCLEIYVEHVVNIMSTLVQIHCRMAEPYLSPLHLYQFDYPLRFSWYRLQLEQQSLAFFGIFPSSADIIKQNCRRGLLKFRSNFFLKNIAWHINLTFVDLT